MIGPCAKQRVRAVIILYDGTTFYGENACTNPQTTCPRLPGEAYLKCYSICGQLGHAEETALRQVRMAGRSHQDIKAIFVFGHTGPCDNCRALLDSLGLLELTKFYPESIPADRAVDPDDHIAQAYNLSDPSSHSRSAK